MISLGHTKMLGIDRYCGFMAQSKPSASQAWSTPPSVKLSSVDPIQLIFQTHFLGSMWFYKGMRKDLIRICLLSRAICCGAKFKETSEQIIWWIDMARTAVRCIPGDWWLGFGATPRVQLVAVEILSCYEEETTKAWNIDQPRETNRTGGCFQLSGYSIYYLYMFFWDPLPVCDLPLLVPTRKCCNLLPFTKGKHYCFDSRELLQGTLVLMRKVSSCFPVNLHFAQWKTPYESIQHHMDPYGGFLKWGYPQIIHLWMEFPLNRILWGYLNLWKHPYNTTSKKENIWLNPHRNSKSQSPSLHWPASLQHPLLPWRLGNENLPGQCGVALGWLDTGCYWTYHPNACVSLRKTVIFPRIELFVFLDVLSTWTFLWHFIMFYILYVDFFQCKMVLSENRVSLIPLINHHIHSCSSLITLW